MQLSEIKSIAEGMIIFSENAGLMCSVKNVGEDGSFGFSVANGLWDGKILMTESGTVMEIYGNGGRRDVLSARQFASDFKLVESVTSEEFSAWYMRHLPNQRLARRLINRDLSIEGSIADVPSDQQKRYIEALEVAREAGVNLGEAIIKMEIEKLSINQRVDLLSDLTEKARREMCDEIAF